MKVRIAQKLTKPTFTLAEVPGSIAYAQDVLTNYGEYILSMGGYFRNVSWVELVDGDVILSVDPRSGHGGEPLPTEYVITQDEYLVYLNA